MSKKQKILKFPEFPITRKHHAHTPLEEEYGNLYFYKEAVEEWRKAVYKWREGLVNTIKDRIKDLETSIKSASKFGKPLSLITKQRAYEEFLVLLGAKELSDEFMETLRKSQEDKKAGKVRPYEEIAKECGLGTKKEKEC